MKLYVGNLAKEINEAELNALAVKYGALKSWSVARERNGDSKGFGFLEFTSTAEANAAIVGLNGREVGGRMLKVAEARNQVPADPLGGRY